MPAVYFTSDTHFGHLKALEFRPGFESIEEHNEFLIERWNSVVRPSDMVWHLGDVALGNKSFVSCIARCNGRKKLVLGNHDTYKIQEYLPYFAEVYGAVRAYHGLVLTHIPVREQYLENRWKANIHGHNHSSHIDDNRYFNVCVDVRDFKPISLDEVKSSIN